MKKLAMLTAAAAMAAFGFAGTAYADQKIGGQHCGGTQDSHPCSPDFKGLFESPLVIAGGDQVGGSEGKANVANGIWKVELLDGVGFTDYDICFADTASGSGNFLKSASSDEDGELRVTGAGGDGIPAGDHEAFAFEIYLGSNGDCSGALAFVSGFTV